MKFQLNVKIGIQIILLMVVVSLFTPQGQVYGQLSEYDYDGNVLESADFEPSDYYSGTPVGWDGNIGNGPGINDPNTPGTPSFWEWLTGGFDSITDWLESGLNNSGISDWIKDFLDLWDAVGGWEGIGDLFSGWIDSQLQPIYDFIEGIQTLWDHRELIANILAALALDFIQTNVIDPLLSFVTQIVEINSAIYQWIIDGWNSLSPLVQDIILTIAAVLIVVAVIALIALIVVTSMAGLIVAAVAAVGAVIGGAIYALLYAGTDNFSFLGALTFSAIGAAIAGGIKAFVASANALFLTMGKTFGVTALASMFVEIFSFTFFGGELNIRNMLTNALFNGLAAVITLGLSNILSGVRLWLASGTTFGFAGLGATYFNEGIATWTDFFIYFFAGTIAGTLLGPLLKNYRKKLLDIPSINIGNFLDESYITAITNIVANLFKDIIYWGNDEKHPDNKIKKMFETIRNKIEEIKFNINMRINNFINNLINDSRFWR
ncbi:hypothetical protein [Alkalihalobacterium bogoriense]|uniref:hypothetical protein n=1 Tax=Alkalihalobacterium bogoriense TaxID=246272 RepID=UPI000478B7E2|nr:hypothetical protein [Alkalihalobacterium bogoriense]